MEQKTSSQYILDTARDYSLYVCQDRSIPKGPDGLKDVQRKALWLIRSKSDKIKTISLAGEMISSGLYLHGDASAAEAISLLAAPYLNNIPLLEGIGTFGTRVAPKKGIGAPRYTYVQRGQVAQKLVLPDLDIVPVKENYDGSNIEPEFFLPIVPLLLLNGVSGIAVGWSTEILPRKLSDLITACKNVLTDKPVGPLTPCYANMDMTVEHVDGNTWELVGKIQKLDTSTVRVIELPPDISLEKFKEKLNAMEEKEEINTYTDNSTEQIDIEVKFARGSIKDITEDELLRLLKLRQKTTERIVIIDWNGTSIRTYASAQEFVKDFVAWRLGWYRKRYEHLRKISEDQIRWDLILLACFEADLPKKIQTCKNKRELVDLVNQITKDLEATPEQCDKVASLPSYRWTEESKDETENDIVYHENLIETYDDILNNEKKLKKIYINELDDLAKCKWAK